MSDKKTLKIQQGVWIEERWLRSAGFSDKVQVHVEPGEIRIVDVPEKKQRQQALKKGWDIFRSLGNNASAGRLPNAAEEHDRYLYGNKE